MEEKDLTHRRKHRFPFSILSFVRSVYNRFLGGLTGSGQGSPLFVEGYPPAPSQFTPPSGSFMTFEL